MVIFIQILKKNYNYQDKNFIFFQGNCYKGDNCLYTHNEDEYLNNSNL